MTPDWLTEIEARLDPDLSPFAHEALTEEQVKRLLSALKLAMDGLKLSTIRLEVLVGRIRACHEETGKHELLEEAEAFVSEARETLAKLNATTNTKKMSSKLGGEG